MPHGTWTKTETNFDSLIIWRVKKKSFWMSYYKGDYCEYKTHLTGVFYFNHNINPQLAGLE